MQAAGTKVLRLAVFASHSDRSPLFSFNESHHLSFFHLSPYSISPSNFANQPTSFAFLFLMFNVYFLIFLFIQLPRTDRYSPWIRIAFLVLEAIG